MWETELTVVHRDVTRQGNKSRETLNTTSRQQKYNN